MSVLKVILYALGVVVFLFLVVLLYFSLNKYNPEEKQVIDTNSSPEIIQKNTFDLLIWNIGYCGLGEDMSFFYDGGSQVRTFKSTTLENLRRIKEQLNKFKDADFILLQEVDIASKRSYHINQFEELNKHFKDLKGYFAMNYNVRFIPVPPTEPLGQVQSGLALFSRYQPREVIRFDYPGKYRWPKSVFMLDRCFIVSRYILNQGKNLVVINTHNSAYDQGQLKEKEMLYLKEFLINEYNKGNFVIAGGDWNQYPPGTESLTGNENLYDLEGTSTISSDFMPRGWKWIYDAEKPTNRSLKRPYNKKTKTKVIDFYLASPNIVSLKVKTIDLDFRNSDHQPVFLRMKLKSNRK
jgi:endonuclease/exonuclease/phosphatase family metal-dependent hydrolase